LKALEKKLATTNRAWDKKVMKKNGLFMQIIQDCSYLQEFPDKIYAEKT
jgi:hypothetical protein